MSARADREPHDEPPVDQLPEKDSRELVLRAREGDKSSAYEVLGQQHPIEVWVGVLQALAKDPREVDLELVAHRALRRPAPVVSALLQLARAAETPVAAFLARVIAESRDEEQLRSDASALNEELVKSLDVHELLAAEDDVDALYATLARPLRDEAEIVAQIEPDAGATAALFGAARSEYERLQEVARDTRWRSGSYRHALRHAIADLALVAGAGGRLEDQAYRLLQLRTEEPAANAELLELVSSELRSRYLEWTLDRSAAESSPARALFALAELERHPDAVDRATVGRLLLTRNEEVGAAAAIFLVAHDPLDGSLDRDIAELLSGASPSARAALVRGILQRAPQRLRLDIWPPAVDPIVAEGARGNSEAIERLEATLRGSPDEEARLRALQLLAEVGETAEDPVQLATSIAEAVVHGPAASQQLGVLLGAPWLRTGAWRTVAKAPAAVRDEYLAGLIEADPPIVVWPELDVLHGSEDEPRRHELEVMVLEAVSEGRLGVDELAQIPSPDLVEALKPAAQARLTSAAAEVSCLRSLVALGDQAAEIELAERLHPLIARAIDRSTGNERLTGDYRELAATLAPVQVGSPSVGTSEIAPSALEELALGLKATGIALSTDGGDVWATFDDEVGAPQLIRALAIVEQRAERAATGPARETPLAALEAIAETAARAGLAEAVLRGLFERGPLFQAAIALSPVARTALLKAAIDAGFEPPAAWRDHDVLGPWLQEASGDTSGGDSERTAVELLIELRQTEDERRRVEQRLEAGRSAARQAFVSGAKRPLEDLEQTADTYIQLWLGLARLGISQVAALGERIEAGNIDPARHEIVGDEAHRSYVVRSGGLAIEGEIVQRARVEAFD